MKKIESARYRKGEDSDEDSIYMRVNKKHSKEASRGREQTLERSDRNKKRKCKILFTKRLRKRSVNSSVFFYKNKKL